VDQVSVGSNNNILHQTLMFIFFFYIIKNLFSDTDQTIMYNIPSFVLKLFHFQSDFLHFSLKTVSSSELQTSFTNLSKTNDPLRNTARGYTGYGPVVDTDTSQL
jgi:hypothetical protein